MAEGPAIAWQRGQARMRVVALDGMAEGSAPYECGRAAEWTFRANLQTAPIEGCDVRAVWLFQRYPLKKPDVNAER